MTDILSLVRDNILQLKAYRCARDDYDSGILLDANENAYGSVISHDLPLHRYPDPCQSDLKQEISKFRDVKSEQIFTGVGSDEAIDILIRIFCNPGLDSIMIMPPTYGMYKVAADINNVNTQYVPLTDSFQIQTELVLNSITDKTKLIFICTPNNPTGNLLSTDSILEITEQSNAIVVVDEAYIDFSGQESLARKIDNYPNLIVLQTLSKSFGLAGIRLGIALSSKEIIAIMNKVKAPYNVNVLTSQIAIDALKNSSKMRETVSKIDHEKQFLTHELKSRSVIKTVYTSDANFILFQTDRAYLIYRELAAKGVVIRYRGDQLHCENSLRITVGTRKENQAFLTLFDQLTS